MHDFKGAAQAALAAFVDLLGTPFALHKRQLMAAVSTFLGVTHDLSKAIDEGTAYFRPKDSLLEKASTMILEALTSQRLTPGGASKLRGTLGPLMRETWGKIGRGGMGPLIQREFVDKWPWTLSRSLKASFEFPLAVLAMDARREMKVDRARRPCIVVASDGASEEGSGASVGALFCSPEARWGWCGRLSEVAMGAWAEVCNPILKVEFYAIVIGLLMSWDAVVGCDLIWFVDNTAALAAAIRARLKTRRRCDVPAPLFLDVRW